MPNEPDISHVGAIVFTRGGTVSSVNGVYAVRVWSGVVVHNLGGETHGGDGNRRKSLRRSTTDDDDDEDDDRRELSRDLDEISY